MANNLTGLQSGESPPNLLYYDATCRSCCVLARLLEKMDRTGILRFRMCLDADARRAGLVESDLCRSAYLISQDGQVFEGFFAFRKLSLLMVPLWPIALLLWLPGSRFLGTRTYRWIADHRAGIFGCGGGDSLTGITGYGTVGESAVVCIVRTDPGDSADEKQGLQDV